MISSDDSIELSDGDEPPEVSTWELNRRLAMDKLDSSESSEVEGIQEATRSAPETAPRKEPMDLKISPACRKRLWKTERNPEESSESSADESPPRARRRGPGEQDPADIGNQSICEMNNKKRRTNSGDSTDLSNGEEPPETSSSALRNGSGADLQALGNEKCSCVMCLSKAVSRGQEVRTESSQASDMMVKANQGSWGGDTMDTGSNSTLEKHSEKRREKRRHISKISNLQKGRKAAKTEPLRRRRKRGLKIPRDKNMDFRPPVLPVTCGQAKGMLYKEKMQQGLWVKCIKMTNGKVLTLKEFEIEGNHARSKNWRLSVRCGGWPLKCLIQKGYLPNPPRTKKKPIPETHSDDFTGAHPRNSNQCKVCRKEGTLYCCDTCPKSFHKECHIHHIDPDCGGR